MPLSDFPWSPTQNFPQFHGTKRKLSQGDIVEQQQEQYRESTAKRRCFLTHAHHNEGDGAIFRADIPASVHMENSHHDLNATQGLWCENVASQGVLSQDLNSNNLFQANDLTQASNLTLASNLIQDSNLSCAQVFVQQPESQLTCTVISHGVNDPSTNMSQDDMIMDLNDETYSTAQIDMYTTEDDAFSTMDSDYVPNPNQYNIQTSHNHCGPSGDHQPTSSVKCYCRPAWDTLQPYVSDYY